MRTTSLIVLSAMLLIVSGCGGSGSGNGRPGPAAAPGRRQGEGRNREQQRAAERNREQEREAERVREKEREAERIRKREREVERIREREREAERIREKELEAERHPDQQDPTPPVNPQHPKRCRVCAHQQTGVQLQPGRSTKVTWTVTGTTQPARVHLKNRHPEAVRGKGGDDQYATSSGGTPNVVTREVTALKEGVFNVDVDVNEQELIPALYRSELRRIAEETRTAADALLARGRQGQRTISTAEVLKVLDDAVADVETSLPFEELTAFRDAVRERAYELRRELSALSVAGRIEHSAIQLVAQRSSDEGGQAGGIPAKSARALLSRFIDYLLGASHVGPMVEICAVTLPVNGAMLKLYPAGDRRRKDEPAESAPVHVAKKTALRLGIYVGLYAWETTMRGFIASSGEVNVLTDPDRILECTLLKNAGDAYGCDLIPGRLNQRCK